MTAHASWRLVSFPFDTGAVRQEPLVDDGLPPPPELGFLLFALLFESEIPPPFAFGIGSPTMLQGGPCFVHDGIARIRAVQHKVPLSTPRGPQPGPLHVPHALGQHARQRNSPPLHVGSGGGGLRCTLLHGAPMKRQSRGCLFMAETQHTDLVARLRARRHRA